MFGKLWPNHGTDSTTTKINDLFHSLPDQHLFRSSLVPYQNSNQFYLNYIFFLHSIVKNANLCLEPNGFISYLLKKRMNKNTLLQGIEDYQGFNDYWIFALAKTHPARQSWSFQKEQGCPSPRGWGEAQDCYCSNCHHPWGMAFENGTSFRGMERQTSLNSCCKASCQSRWLLQSLGVQRDISRTSIPLVHDDAPHEGPLVTPHLSFTVSLVSKRGTKVAL